MEKRIIFATGNEGKMKEVRMILKDIGLPVVSMKEAGIEADIVEDGTTFKENALIKAREIAALTEDIVLADDSGLEIDYLNGAPGIYSARYMGEDTSYDIKNQNLIDRLQGVPDEKRTARFVCAIACVLPNGKAFTTRGVMEGQIGYSISGKNGFGYDPVFYMPEFGCTSAELSPEQKNAVSHRGKALQAMKEKLQEVLHPGKTKILIMSDSHNHDGNVERAIRKEMPMEALIHLGDSQGSEDYIRHLAGCPVYMVAGNCDYFSSLPTEQIIELGGKRMMLTHGHHFYVSVGPNDLLEEAKANQCEIVMYGHTHRPLMDGSDPEVLVLNPGSISFPRQEGKRPSYMVMELDKAGEVQVRLEYL